MSDGIAMVGFGEAGQAFVAGWGNGAAKRVAACDLRAGDGALQADARDLDVALHGAPGPALAGAGMVFCLVTADQALAAATAAAPHLPPGALWIDGNSCAPGTKRRAAAVIDGAGGR